MKENNRISYLDCAKGILISLVAIGHVLLITHSFDTTIGMFFIKLIWSFHMAAFFMISGMLFNEEKWDKKSLKEFVFEKFKKIMIPYLIFEICGSIVYRIWNYGDVDSLLTIIQRIVTVDCYVGSDWFLVTYFFAEIGVFICLRKKKQWLNILLTVITLLIPSLVFGKQLNGITNIIVRCGIGFGLIMLGKLLKGIFTKEKNILFTVLSFIGIIVFSILNEEVLLHVSFTGNPALFFMSSICGTYFIISVAKYIKVNLIEYLGKYSIVVLGTHQNINWILAYYFGAQFTVGCVTFYCFTILVCSIIFVFIWCKIHAMLLVNKS